MRLILCFFLILCTTCPSFAFSFKFKKKQAPQTPKMVETKQDWEYEAQNIPLSDRELKEVEAPKTDKKNYYPEAHYVFEKYNYPPGTRNYDIRFIKKNLVEHPIIVADLKCHYVAYANYYFRADNNQIYSDFYVEKLDTTKSKTKRILSYNHKQLKRIPVLLSGFKEEYRNLFNGLSLVDWSHDSNKVLIKELIGSTVGGIYKTNIYIYFVNEDRTIKLSNFEEAILNYYLDNDDINLKQYRYSLEPLGFNSNNDNMVVVNCFVYNNEGKKIFLGVWGYDLKENSASLISRTSPNVSISTNGLALKRVLE